MTFDQFIDVWNGKAMNFDGKYGNQCVDLFRFYLRDVLQVPQPPGVGGAKELADNYDPKYFTWVKNTPGIVPSKGNVVIFGATSGNKFGHVSVYVSGDVNSSIFKSFDINFPSEGYLDKDGNFIGTGKAHIQNHTWNENILGWLVSKGSDAEPTITIPVKERDRLIGRAVVAKDIGSNLGIDDPDNAPAEKSINVINGIRSRVTDLTTQLTTAKTEVDNRTEQVGRLKEQLLAEEKLRKDLIDQLKKATDSASSVVGVYEARILKLQAEIDNQAKEKGKLASDLAVAEDLLKKAKADAVAILTWQETLALTFQKLFNTKK